MNEVRELRFELMRRDSDTVSGTIAATDFIIESGSKERFNIAGEPRENYDRRWLIRYGVVSMAGISAVPVQSAAFGDAILVVYIATGQRTQQKLEFLLNRGTLSCEETAGAWKVSMSAEIATQYSLFGWDGAEGLARRDRLIEAIRKGDRLTPPV